MLRYRGNAGTHELDLGTKTIEALGRINDEDGEMSVVMVPRYNNWPRVDEATENHEKSGELPAPPIARYFLRGMASRF